MLEKTDRVLEEVHDRSDDLSENARDQDAGEGGGLLALSEVMALVSASVLVCGGIGMLSGVALGALNPFALGIVGAVVGASVPVLFAVGARRTAQRLWWRRVFGS